MTYTQMVISCFREAVPIAFTVIDSLTHMTRFYGVRI